MQFLKNFLPIVASGALILVCNESIGSTKIQERKMTQTINIATRDLPNDLDPINLRAGHHVIIFQAIYQTLIKIDENGEVSPSIARSWRYSKDFKEITFLLDDVYFHNGEKLTSQDIAWSLSRHAWPNSQSLEKGFLIDLLDGADNLREQEFIKGIKILSDNEISLKLKNPYRPMLQLLTTSTFSILNSKLYKNQQRLAGTGAFKVLSSSEDKIELTKFEKFNLANPKGNQIRFFPFHKNSNALELIKDEKVDLVFLGLENSLDDKFTDKVDIQKMENPVFLHLFMNINKNDAFKDHNFRKDVSDLIKNFSKNTKFKSKTQEDIPYLIPKGLLPTEYYKQPRHFASLSPQEFKRKNYSVKIKELDILTTGNLLSPNYLKGLKEHLEQSGFKVHIHNLDRSEYGKEALNTTKYDLVFGAYASDFPDIDGIIAPILGTAGWTYGNYPTSDFKEKLNLAKNDSNNNARLNLYSNYIYMFEKLNYVIPLFRDHARLLYRSDLNVPRANYKYESEIWKIFWEI